MSGKPSPRDDPALPALARALDASAMARILTAAGAPEGADAIGVEVLSYKPGLRCTIRYSVGSSGTGEDAARGSWALIGKLYRSRRRAARMYRRQVDLSAVAFSGSARTRLPAAVRFEEELGLVLQEHVPGRDLRHPLEDRVPADPFRLAGTWLALLHAARPPEGLKVMTAEGRHERLRGWAARVAPALALAARDRLARAVEQAGLALGRRADPPPAVVAHKDFYYANVLWDGTRIWGLDLDELCHGEAAFDLGHFLAHLERHVWRTGLPTDAGILAARAFLEGYGAGRHEASRGSVPFYKGYTFVKLADTEVRRKAENWRNAARTLAGFGCLELETFAGA